MQRLRALLGSAGDSATNFAALEPILTKAVLEHGFHSLQGVTAPLHELMLWRSEATRAFAVELPEGPQPVTVHRLDDFVAWRWLNDARCGHGCTGEWTTDDAIHAVRPGYPDLDAEKIGMSLLGHEARHVADKQRWSLQDWELENRAKLTELVLARESSKSLQEKFARSRGSGTSSPHAYADEHLMAALRRQLGVGNDADLARVSPELLRQAARQVLVADSASRGAPSKDKQRHSP